MAKNKKTTSSGSTDKLVKAIRKDMLSYLGPVFEEQSSNISNLSVRIGNLEGLIGKMDKKFDQAIGIGTDHEATLVDHDKRITHVERDVGTIKNILRSKEG